MARRVIGVVLAVGCVTPEADVVDSAGSFATFDTEIAHRLEGGETVRVLARLDAGLLPDLPDTTAPWAERRARLRDRADAIAWTVDPLLEELPDEVTLVRRYAHVPQVALDVASRRGLDGLLVRADLDAVEVDRVVAATDAQSLALIGQPAAAGAGFRGAGTSVAVLDTGADWTVAHLGACTAVDTPAGCRVAFAQDFAPNDGARDAMGHGTNVSAIVALTAPETDILALDVFNGAGAAANDIIAALDWVVANQATYGIAAVNMSLGSGGYTATCSDVFASATAAVRAAGVVVVAASGNNGYTNAISTPACNPAAVSVGAVYDGAMGSMGWQGCSDATTATDQVTCFSNSATFLDVLAPGALVTAGGATLGGTSQAAPHVAGAFAVLRSADPGATVDALEARLLSTGAVVTDHRTGRAFPRLDLLAAASNCVTSVSPLTVNVGGAGGTGTLSVVAPSDCTWSASSRTGWLTVDGGARTGSGTVGWTAAANTAAGRTGRAEVSGRSVSFVQAAVVPPTGTVTIAGGAAATKTTAVTLTLAASGASQMCVSNTSTCTAWGAYASSLPWTLASGSGTRTVTAWFRDANGNAGAGASDTIVLDVTAPTNGAVTVTPGNGTLTVTWSGFTDASSGIAAYRVMSAVGSTSPASCTTGTPAWSGGAGPAVLTGLVNGTAYALRVCAVDAAGNVGSGTKASGRPVLETTAPVGTVDLVGLGAWTRSRTVTVALAATDASGVTHACLSNAPTCTAWFAMTPTKSWSLDSGSGTRTVYASYKDPWGNVSATVTDSVGLDTGLPTDGTVSATPSAGQVALSWSGFGDAVSGLASYRIAQATSATAPTNCTTAVWTGTGGTATFAGLVDGVTYAWRVCAVDAAGNVSVGAVVTARPASEYTAPVGSVVLNGGATWVTTTGVSAALSASDPSGVTEACLSNTTTCGKWFAFVPTKAWTLSSGSGTRTVTAWFKDGMGNVSAPVSDTIQLDTVAPSNPVVTATGADGRVALTWTASTDATSGVGGYRVAVAAGAKAPANCSAPAWTGTATGATLTLPNGVAHAFRVCAVDVAGNLSGGATATARPAPEYVAPVGSVVVAGGAAWTGTTAVTVALSATDASGVTQACLSTTSSCTAWFPMVASTSFTLSGSSGNKVVYAYFQDPWGNVSAAASDTIGLDVTAPTNGTVTATPGSRSVALTWSGFADAHSGVASYRVVMASGTTAPSNCSGTTVWTGAGTSTTIGSLTGGAATSFRVCAVDAVGRLSTGTKVTATPAP